MNWCYKNEIHVELLLSVNKTFNVSKSLHINNLHHFYITKWNIKLNRHSLYYLTVSAIGMYKTNISNATEISKIHTSLYSDYIPFIHTYRYV